ncbi:Tethering factor for nuclear proteasome STS1 [Fusarium culmorum]|uniref:Tethering factor for nuclear proteasome STS1 n=1 Tax=Fusarium culmorum TaxID=5516 RepID=A0A2T4GH02_FUSCU|nr:Tethering factor for nuclear proteasome STS1 [Fusarium culmorum]
MNVLLSPQPPVFPHQHENPRLSPQRSLSPFHNMNPRKRKADEDGDETMSPRCSPTISARALARPSKKVRGNEIIGRPLTLPRLLETLDTSQLRTVLERICESHPDIGHEVVTQAPRPSVSSAVGPEYTYYRVKEPLVAFIDALSDFTPQFLPPNETQPTKSLEFLNEATDFIHRLPNWEPQAYRHHKETAYEEISKAWALVINEAGKKAGLEF